MRILRTDFFVSLAREEGGCRTLLVVVFRCGARGFAIGGPLILSLELSTFKCPRWSTLNCHLKLTFKMSYFAI
jgi:hypothetical protein